jgi:5-methylcytosine-specific restriction endonuclease McrA
LSSTQRQTERRDLGPELEDYLEELPASPISRLPRRLKGQLARELFRGKMKRAMKRATLRTCSRRCVYCGQSVEPCNATLDHVYPLAHGGRHERANLVAACKSCNQLKGDMLPLQFFFTYPWAGQNFLRYARAVHRAFKRGAQRAVSLALAGS